MDIKILALAARQPCPSPHCLATGADFSEAMQKVKANSSRWLGENGVRFEWQKGYGAFSVSPSLLPTVQAYIRNQEEHHKSRSFEEEFVALLKKSGVAYDAERIFAA